MLRYIPCRQILILVWCGISASAYAQEAVKMVDIPAGDLGDALSLLARQSGAEFVYAQDDVRGVHTGGVQGMYTAEAATLALLAGTQRRVAKVHENGAMLISHATGESSGPTPASSLPIGNTDDRRARTDAARQSVRPRDLSRDKLEEVIVTARKQIENLQDVPVPVTVVDADALTSANQLRVEDYFDKIPGVSLLPGFGQSSQITIRGLSTGSDVGNPAVGVVIDDIPYGSSVIWGGGMSVPDVDPGDLKQLEVLRGPQGTLYGASSLGGLLKFVTLDPSTDRLSGNVQIGSDRVKGGSDLGYTARAAVNVPISDSFAIRASAFTRMDPGYLDNVRSGLQNDVNWTKGKGGHVSALWRPSDVLTLKLSAILQRTETGGDPNVAMGPSFGDLQQTVLKDTGLYTKDIRAYSATLTARLGTLELTSLTGYSTYKNSGNLDYDLVSNFRYFTTPDDDKFSQELRLDIPLGEHFSWLIGAFYNKDHASINEKLDESDPVTGAQIQRLIDLTSGGTNQEYAAFSTLTYNVTDRFDVQFGAREAHYKQKFSQLWVGPVAQEIFGAPVFRTNPVLPKDSSFTYLITPRFRISSDLMVYARVASGYRTGSANSNPTPNLQLANLKPDTTRNYELGLKGNFLNRVLTVDASVYSIYWKDIQLFTTDLTSYSVPVGLFVNANSAKSRGVELSLEARPLKGLTIDLSGAVSDAKLTEDMPSNVTTAGRSGDRLPYSSSFSGHFSLEQAFSLSERMTGFAGTSLSYTPKRSMSFRGDPDLPPVTQLPAFVRTDFRAGVRYDNWNVGLYLNNAFDRRAIITVNELATQVAGGTGNVYARLLEPRTLGLTLSRSF